MHCVTLADLAATLAKHADCFWESKAELPSETMMQYWASSRTRHELWHRVMTRYRFARNSNDYFELKQWWSEHHVVLEEVLVSDLLARVVAAIGAQASQLGIPPARGSYENLAAITHGVFVSQVEASNRVAQIMLESSGATVRDVVGLNRLRLGVQRWSDWLIGSVAVDFSGVAAYCIDRRRAQEFHRETREFAIGRNHDTTRWLMNAAMHDMLVRRTSDRAGLPQANYEVAVAAMALFQPQLFDDYGVPKSAWLQRLQAGNLTDTKVPPVTSVPLAE